MKEKIIKSIVSELKTRYKHNTNKKIKELNKVLRFVKSSNYFEGKRRNIYKIIIKAKKD